MENDGNRFFYGYETFLKQERYGRWVIDDACRQARKWRKAGLRMRVAINLSPAQMRQDDLVDRILESLQRYGIDPSRLTCEITESLAMEDTQATQRTFEILDTTPQIGEAMILRPSDTPPANTVNPQPAITGVVSIRYQRLVRNHLLSTEGICP